MAVEGAPLSGARASFLAKERQKSQAIYVEKISQLKEKGSSVGGLAVMQTKFSSATATTASKGLNSIEQEEEKAATAAGNGKKKDKKRAMKTLSFAEEEGEGEDGGESEEMTIALMKKKKLKKNPDVETSFLPDREREEDMEEAKEKLRLEWQETQKVVREEMLEVIYSYWDGTGHRRSIKLKKGTTIGEFLELVRQQLSKEFKEARTSSSDEYMYVKEDLIIPHSYSFYDLIIRKARGKSGPLFQFDVHEDIRLMGDATVEKDESHPGKVVSRRWYDRNKHIFPASRWEVFDIEAKRSEKYSIK